MPSNMQLGRVLSRAISKSPSLASIHEAMDCDRHFDGGEFSGSFDYGLEKAYDAIYVRFAKAYGMSLDDVAFCHQIHEHSFNPHFIKAPF
jgi:hypothetical protein